jgi:hypothetical protein
MPVLKASNNGGKYNTVHNQTNDGSVISVLVDGEYVPLLFSWIDYLDTCQSHLLAAGKYYHERLMRSDCGLREAEDDSVTTFSWDQLEDNVDGFSSGPNGEFRPITSQTRNTGRCVEICGTRGHRKIFFRKDREYWTPDVTLAPTTEEPIFGLTQYNPISCPPDPKDNCGKYILKGDKKKC